mmetsp:Transcript_24243/g.35923  ORF Transcript_24243/g.35923 Transcript_24243/m.35923 type:complete len:592 (-) Transcript_24243:271-2046(-)|eukprot:CAMPEP_0194224216 /NCGR_PEP_ID=MMETSP0156-20130528/36926_1 /TAXON_ID=33649 /ORGANISM="Thalassionema nitzschioides, Strain L26-B" /LENGTH=591 /DNA_ID=CAMNT_0038955667 /DNA_START=101 /DNA_END=1876 /DNA_ORIENTATION=+
MSVGEEIPIPSEDENTDNEIIDDNQKRRRSLFFATICIVLMLALSAFLSKLETTNLSRNRYNNFEKERELDNDKSNDKEEDENNKDRDHNGNGLEFDDAVYIDDDVYIDDYHAYQEDPGPPTLMPLETNDILGLLFASMGVLIAAGGGIGGGGIALPVYIMVMGLSPRDAIPISAVTVFGGSLATLLVTCRKRHPLADRPLIDWNLVLVMEPLVVIGALLGALLQRLISEKFLVVMLVIFLSITAHTTLSKARRMYRAETVYIEKLRNHQCRYPHLHQPEFSAAAGWPPQNQPNTIPPILSSSTNDSMPPPAHPFLQKKSGSDGSSFGRQEILILNPDFVSLRSDVLKQSKVTPCYKILALCFMFCIIIFLNIMVGGGVFYSPWGIECGSYEFWGVHLIMAIFLIASAWSAQTYLIAQHEIKQLILFDYVQGDIQWDQQAGILYTIMFFAAGIFAGVFGIGGGMVCVPVLLTMGVHPMVASATSSCMILFTSIASVTSFSIFGLILWDYAAVCLAVGFFPTLIGMSLMQRVRKTTSYRGYNFERNSIITFAIGAVILLSALMMTVLYIFSIVTFDEDDQLGICEGYKRGTV